jgi:hypothetical protein
MEKASIAKETGLTPYVSSIRGAIIIPDERKRL